MSLTLGTRLGGLRDLAIPFEPGACVRERRALEPAGPPLRVLPDADQPCPFQDLQVLGHGGLADCKRLGELGDRGVSERQSRQDRAPGRIGERPEGGIEASPATRAFRGRNQLQ